MPLNINSKRFKYLNNINKFCPVCGKEIYDYDENIEYCLTKRKSHIFIHTECVPKWGD